MIWFNKIQKELSPCEEWWKICIQKWLVQTGDSDPSKLTRITRYIYRRGYNEIFKDIIGNESIPQDCNVQLKRFGFGAKLLPAHTKKPFRNLTISNRNQIAFTIHRLIWNRKGTSVWFKISRKMLNTIWFQFDLIRIRTNFSECAGRPVWTIFTTTKFAHSFTKCFHNFSFLF